MVAHCNVNVPPLLRNILFEGENGNKTNFVWDLVVLLQIIEVGFQDITLIMLHIQISIEQ